MTNQPTCGAKVYPIGAFRGFPCLYAPRWWVTFRDGRVDAFCGVHVRKYRRNPALVVEPL